MMYSPNIIPAMDQPNAQFFLELYLNTVMYILLNTICECDIFIVNRKLEKLSLVILYQYEYPLLKNFLVYIKAFD